MWSCTHNSTCRAKLKVLGRTILREDRHTCLPQQHHAISQTLKEQCKEKAKNSPEPITKIYKDAVKTYIDAGYNLVQDVPDFNSIKSSLYRSRNACLDVTKTSFTNTKDVEVPAQFEDFVLLDHNEEERILMFASMEGRRLIEEGDVFLFDGTFKSCAKPFYQLYSMHTDIGSSENQTNIVPVLFALLPNKMQRTYEILLNSVKQSLPGWKPRKAILDFEQSAINAIKTCLPDVIIKGCNFHFKQALAKKSKVLGFSTSEERNHLATCAALAFLPTEDVEDGWLAIMETCPVNEKITNFNNYFVDTWLNNPSLHYSIWNCQGERHRTTNLVEAWHKSLNGVLKKKPRLLELLFTIREQAQYFEKYHRPQANRSRRAINKDLNIKIIDAKYKEKSISIVDALNQYKTLCH